jgi:hypothetical protein
MMRDWRREESYGVGCEAEAEAAEVKEACKGGGGGGGGTECWCCCREVEEEEETKGGWSRSPHWWWREEEEVVAVAGRAFPCCVECRWEWKGEEGLGGGMRKRPRVLERWKRQIPCRRRRVGK